MNERQIRRDTEKVVRKVFRIVQKQDTIGKQEFEAVNRKVIEYVSKHTGIAMEEVVAKMNVVIKDLPQEYGQLDPTLKSWETLIAYLYTKYLKELGML